MNDFILMILDNEAQQAKVTPAEMQKLIEQHARFGEQLRKNALYRDGERLRPEAKRVKGKAIVDGPFPESKEALGGYYLVRAENLDAAAEIAKGCPMFDGDTIEVRGVMSGELPPNKTDEPGKVFAFAVVGDNAVMDQVDDETSASFEGDKTFVGGVRLEARGKRIVSEKGKKRVIEGPFPESKEVVGGLFFSRLPSMDDAVRYALASPFMKRVSLEIRELWRTH